MHKPKMSGPSKASLLLSLILLIISLFDLVIGGQISSLDLYNLKKNEATVASRSLDQDSSYSPTCGYQSCPEFDPEKINVHLIAHTHDDVGWLKTVDQYYYGTKKRFNHVGVQYILDSVIPQLAMDETKRFIYVEMSFFSKWWNEQDESTKILVKRLVDEGRLEFINGGWCMNDEATVSYQSVIEQMTLGLKFLNETFGSCARPKSGWQIDPFGHTNEQASLFAQFGFDGMFFMRIGYRDKSARIRNKTLDIIWHGDRILSGQSGSIFANIFRDTYDSPPGFCFDVQCLDDNLVDNKKSYEYNMDSKGNEFIEYIRSYAANKALNHILIPLGGDFHYSAAGQNFKNSDKLIKYVRAEAPDINIFYSTPSCYQAAFYQGSKTKSMRIPEKYDDFMPYDHMDSVWWSGYFSSRPSVKLIERDIVNLLQVSRMVSLANLIKPQVYKRWSEEVRDHENKCLMPLWEVLGDLQHHDAVTGTEKQHVADDYVRRASDAAASCAKFIGDLRRSKLTESIKKQSKYEQRLKEPIAKRLKLDPIFLETTSFCPWLNISQCDPLESEVNLRPYVSLLNQTNTKITDLSAELSTKSTLLNIYNPLTQPLEHYDIRLPCNGRCDLDKVQVIHLSTNETMNLNRLPVPTGVQSLTFRNATTNYEYLFYANVPPLGYTSFLIEDLNDEEIIDEETDQSNPAMIVEERSGKLKNPTRGRRPKRAIEENEEILSNDGNRFLHWDWRQRVERGSRFARDTQSNQSSDPERIIVKFDLNTGTIAGLKRASDGAKLDITQKFGYYHASSTGHPAGAYIFRPNTSEPILFDKPQQYKMYKRRNGSLIEIHQKWADWLWQTIRVDARKKYIEFDYVVGPIPVSGKGREIVTRYVSNLTNHGVFMTDSNGRQMMSRKRSSNREPTQLGGSFYPVVSSIMIKNLLNTTSTNAADMVAILVDRPQAGTSLSEGQLELLIHRRLLADDYLGVDEQLDEPGEDGRGLVTRGTHRLYLKFSELPELINSYDSTHRSKTKLFKLPETPRSNLEFEAYAARKRSNHSQPFNKPTFVAHDRVLDELRQEARKLAMKPTLTFDRIRMSAIDFMALMTNDGNVKLKTDLSILNTSLPSDIHLLTLQPWSGGLNQLLIRLENLNNPLTIHPFTDIDGYNTLLRHYKANSDYSDIDADEYWERRLRAKVDVDIEYLIKKIRITNLEELSLGANARLEDVKRLNWTGEVDSHGESLSPNSISLGPRQIRSFLATFEPL